MGPAWSSGLQKPDVDPLPVKRRLRLPIQGTTGTIGTMPGYSASAFVLIVSRVSCDMRSHHVPLPLLVATGEMDDAQRSAVHHHASPCMPMRYGEPTTIGVLAERPRCDDVTLLLIKIRTARLSQGAASATPRRSLQALATGRRLPLRSLSLMGCGTEGRRQGHHGPGKHRLL